MKGILGKLFAPSAQLRGQWIYGPIAASLLLHAVVVVALIGGLDWKLPEPETTSISVDLVPPPEPEEPELQLSEQENPAEQTPESAPPPEGEQQSGEETDESLPALPVLKPVVEFAETDGGSQVDPEGVAQQDPNEAESEEPDKPESPATVAQDDEGADTGLSEAEREEALETPDEPLLDLPGISELALESGQVADAEAVPDNPGEDGPDAAFAPPASEPVPDNAAATPEETGTPEVLTSAKKLFSEAALDNPRSQTAMGKMPRSERANLLCMTEMRGQLLATRPPRPPEVLPTFALPAGTVLETHRAAFRSQGKWYDLAFRCEMDEGVTKVLNFSFRVGDAIPRSQWSQRGFPSF